MNDIVIDTSVIVKWFAEEEDSDKARTLLELTGTGRANLVLPGFAQLEIINILKISKSFSRKEIAQKITDFFNLIPRFVEIDQDYSLAIADLIFTHNLAAYDAAFIAVADRWGISLVTADYKHHQKDISPNIVWLKEWQGKLPLFPS